MQIFKLPPRRIAPPIDPYEITNPASVLGTTAYSIEPFDAKEALGLLRKGGSVDEYSRKELIEISRLLKCDDEDTRGKPVKAIREILVSALAASEVAEAVSYKPSPVKMVKLSRHLT